MQKTETINLLVSCASQAQLESYLALFRDAGQSIRAHRLNSLRELGDMLRDQSWDLLIAVEGHPEIALDAALNTLRTSEKDVPCIVRMTNPASAEATALLKAGARDVIGLDRNEHLLLAANREIAAVRAGRELASLRELYEETARRCELLLAASQDAIAYVVDGMHVHANALYAELFHYADIDEIASIPLVDLISGQTQKEFKDALRRYRDHPEEQTTIGITGLRADGSEFPARLVLSTASYESEPCMQVLVRADATAAAPAAPAVASGSAAPQGIAALRGLIAGGARGHLFLISLDGFAQNARNLGVTIAHRLVDEVGVYLSRSNDWPAMLRVADSVLALNLPQSDPEWAANEARQLVEQIARHIHEIGDQSVPCSACVAVCPLDNPTDPTVEALIDRSWRVLAAAVERGSALRSGDVDRVGVLDSAATVAPVAAASAGLNLVHALKAGEFKLLFQPIVSLRGDSSEYYEVHAVHAAGDEPRPAHEWLLDACPGESSSELDHWTIIEANKKLADYRKKHPHTRLILPIGEGSILDPDFPGWLGVAIRAADLNADSLVVQLPHAVVSKFLKQAKMTADRVRALGCQISVSGIHIANNPIPDLVHVRPNFARVDDSLALGLENNEVRNTALKPLIEALHHEQMVSIMPRVRAASALAVLWQLGVNFIQGDYLRAATPQMDYEFTDLA